MPQRRKQRSIGVIGVFLVLIVLLAELRAGASPGIGPYQMMLLWLGFALAGLGFARMDSNFFHLSLAATSLAILVIVLELTAPWIERVLPQYPSSTVPDPILGSRYRPNFLGHDTRGWRNRSALETAKVVAIGDSQTWGMNATMDETWTMVLSNLTGLSVYNMAQGGYGPMQYAQLAHEALKLSPEILVVSLYFGNDIAEAYNLTYGLDFYKDYRILSPDDMTLDYDIISAATLELRQYWDVESRVLAKYAPRSFAAQLRYETAIGRLLDSRGAWPTWIDTRADLNQRAKIMQADSAKLSWDIPIYLGSDTVTLFTPNYRWILLRQDDPRLREGLRLTQQSMTAIQKIAQEHSIRFLVLLIPTKELVYADAMAAQDGVLSSDYARLVATENSVRREIISYLDASGIQWVDSLPNLQRMVGEPIYPSSTDGHPMPMGYYTIAESVATALDTPVTQP